MCLMSACAGAGPVAPAASPAAAPKPAQCLCRGAEPAALVPWLSPRPAAAPHTPQDCWAQPLLGRQHRSCNPREREQGARSPRARGQRCPRSRLPRDCHQHPFPSPRRVSGRGQPAVPVPPCPPAAGLWLHPGLRAEPPCAVGACGTGLARRGWLGAARAPRPRDTAVGWQCLQWVSPLCAP